MIVMMSALALLVVIVVVMLVIVMMTVLALLVVIVAVMMMTAANGTSLLLGEGVELSRKGGGLLHGREDLRAGQIVPRGSDDDRLGVLFPQKGYGVGDLLLGAGLGVAENDGACVLDLVVVELTEVLHIHLALVGIGNGGVAVEHHVVREHGLHRANDVRELANARGLDEDAVRSVLRHYLCQSLGEVAYQGAADAAGVHLVDGDTGILQEAAVDADLAELVLDEDDFLSGVGFGQELFDKGSLTGSQKAGEYIDFGHYKSEPFL